MIIIGGLKQFLESYRLGRIAGKWLELVAWKLIEKYSNQNENTEFSGAQVFCD